MLTDFIVEQVKEKKRVIIPDFGAILAREDAKGNFNYSFSPFLKYNDGVIVNFLSNTNNIPKDEAIAKIKEYINNITSEINEKGSFTFSTIGKLVKDNKGSYKIISETDAVSKPKANQETPKSKAPAKEASKENISQKEAPKTKEPVKRENKKEEKKEPKVQIKKADATPASEGNTKTILIIVISIVILASATFTLWKLEKFPFNKTEADTEQKITEKTPEQTEDDKLKIDKTLSQEEAQAEDVKKEIKPTESIKEKTPAQPGVKKYHIIAGSFKNKAYALNYAERMKTEGFETEIISKTDGMNVVSIGSFLNKKEATVRLKELRALEKQVWLLYY